MNIKKIIKEIKGVLFEIMYDVLAISIVITLALSIKTLCEVDTLHNEIDELSIAIENIEPIAIKEIEYIEPNFVGNGDLVEVPEPEFDHDFELVASVVASESMGESYNGQVAVAQCIYNTAQATGMSPAEVVSEPKQYADPMPYSEVSESVINACLDVFLNGNFVTDEPIRYFYSPANMPNGTSSWHENSLEYVMTIGGHRFFKE